MPKEKIAFVCSSCGHRTPRWQGKCPSCGEWNTFVEQAPAATRFSGNAQAGKPVKLSELEEEKLERISSGLGEMDAVLGGGIVPGSLILLGGEPGIGKSTLALQLALHAAGKNQSVLYVSGEESARQIKLRSSRLSGRGDVPIFAETNLETVIATITGQQPDLVIIDSIQTLNSNFVNGVVGGVSQLSFATNALLRTAKERHTAIILIGHVTKEGMLAGPKTIEHMVDTVLYLEGERFSALRILRCSKNRFGSAGEVGVFEMLDSGLVELANPSERFLEHRDKPLAGSCTTAILEGNKVLLLEVQALTTTSNFGYPKRATSGFDINRLQLLLAILQKSLKLNLNNQDVYVNVAGGFKLDERAADLPVALAILSSFNGVPLPAESVAFGEVGLLGELRGVSQIEKRLKEAEKLGFKQAIVAGRMDKTLANKFKKLDIASVQEIQDLIRWVK